MTYQCGAHSFAVIGHDFGAALAWRIASHFPARVWSLVALSVGHGGAVWGAGNRLTLPALGILVLLSASRDQPRREMDTHKLSLQYRSSAGSANDLLAETVTFTCTVRNLQGSYMVSASVAKILWNC